MGKRKSRSSGTSSPKTALVMPESKRHSSQTTPDTNRLSSISATNMAGARPKIIRTSYDDIAADKCVLTDVLDTLRHSKTSSTGKYEFFPPKSSKEGLEEYNAHWDTFLNTLGDAFFRNFLSG